MVPVDGRDLPGVPSLEMSRIIKWCRAVGERTMTHPWFNTMTRGVHFCLTTDPSVGVESAKVVSKDGCVTLPPEDAICRKIYRCRMSRRQKDAEQERMRLANEAEAKREREAHCDAVRPETISRVKHAMNKLDMGRHSKPSVVNPGLNKGVG